MFVVVAVTTSWPSLRNGGRDEYHGEMCGVWACDADHERDSATLPALWEPNDSYQSGKQGIAVSVNNKGQR